MGDINQLTIVQRNLELVGEPVIEIGSKDYGSTPDFRSLVPGLKYVGVDMEAGKGVDVVVDLTDSFDRVDEALGGLRFNTIICFSVLEHCRNPFKMCETITGLLQEGGRVFISVPFSWQIHTFPSDYWRFTAAGVRALFPELGFEEARSWMSTSEPGQIRPLTSSCTAQS